MRTEWHKLTELAKDEFRVVPSGPGIYVARWSKEGKAVSIARLAKFDLKGILYVNSAKSLKKRIRLLWGGITQESRAHPIFETILFCKVSETIPPSEYEISWKELMTPEEARGKGWIAMKTYAEKYKELPPLSHGLRREQFAVAGIAKADGTPIAYESDDFIESTIV